MSDEIKLTLDPMGDENKQELDSAVAAAVQATEALEKAETEAKQEVQQATLDMQSFTEEEQKMIDDFSEKIDVRDSNLVFSYGAAAQQNISQFSDAALKNVQTKDLDEVGNMISNLVMELKSFDTDDADKGGLFGLFKKQVNKLELLKTKYDHTEVNVNKLVSELENHQVTLLKDIATMEQLYDMNLSYFKELSMYIVAGKKRLEDFRATELAEARAKAEANVDQVVKILEQHQVNLMKDVAMLDQMYDLNQQYYKELTMYILAGKKRLKEVQEGELKELKEKAQSTGRQEDAEAFNDYANMVNRFEKKIHDLELTRMVSIQMGPQTRLLQNNDTLMIEKIQTSLVNTIPLWKSQMVLALGLEHGRQATAAQNQVTEMTNQLLKKNAEMLHMSTVATAREAERSIVDIETLQHTNQELISTLDEVLAIQKESSQRRQEAEAELGRIEGELKQKLLALRG